MKRTLIAVMMALPGMSFAAAPATVHDMTLDLATTLASDTLAQCRQYDKKGVVAVVDRGGNPVVVMRDDNVGPHNTLAAQRKAYTALSTKTPSQALAEKARADADSANLNTLPELLLLGGGVPVTFNNEVIGAVGVAGMGGSEFDGKCATQAIAKAFPAK